MRLPIYRRLDERLQILGLSLMELAVVAGVYVLLAELLSFFAYGTLVAVFVSLTIFGSLVYLQRKFESHILQKWLRYISLPEGLPRSIMSSERSLKNA